MIKAVFWDFGGVLTTSPFEAFNRFERERSMPKDFIRGINAANPLDNAWARFESSRITVDEFDRAFLQESEAAGHPITGREVIALLKGNLRPRMVEALKRCKQQFKVACLTNNIKTDDADAEKDPFTADGVTAVMALFDAVVESRSEGVRKPEPAFYTLACERLNVAPAEAVFLDDLGINLKPARALGMTTIKVVTEDQALAELEQVLGIALTS